MTVLVNRLVLHHFICREFGYDDMSDILNRLRDVPAEFDDPDCLGRVIEHALRQ